MRLKVKNGSGEQRALFKTLQCLLGVVLGPVWGTVGVYPFTMSQKEKSSAFAETQDRRQGAKPGGKL